MTKKNKAGRDGIVFSTDPDFRLDEDEEKQERVPPAKQMLRVWLDTKHRAGKAVTIVGGFAGPDDDLEALGRQVKSHCGTGGSVKDREIIIQGDHRDKVLQWLLKKGFERTKKL